MIIHTRIKYSILLIIPLILLILLPTVSAANDNRISNENSKSIEAYKQAIIRINPDDADAHYNLGFTYASLNDRDSALAHYYKISISLVPERANELYNMIYK